MASTLVTRDSRVHGVQSHGPGDKFAVADDPTPPIQAAEGRIRLETPEELTYWSDQLGVSAFHLKKVVAKVGPRLADVRHALGIRDWPKHDRDRD